MTQQEAFDYMDLLLDKADQPYFLDTEKEKFLLLASYEYVNIYYPTFGVNQSSRDKLRSFIKTDEIEDVSDKVGGTSISDYYHLISVNHSEDLINFYKAEILSSEEFMSRINNTDPFKKTDVSNPVATIEDDELLVSPPTTANGKVEVKYIGDPKSIINTFSNLNEGQALEIIKIAIRIMGASIESSNYEVFDNEVKTNM